MYNLDVGWNSPRFKVSNKALLRNGLDPGLHTGMMGPVFRVAVKGFQKRRVTGKTDEQQAPGPHNRAWKTLCGLTML
jgi:hypothetical protein